MWRTGFMLPFAIGMLCSAAALADERQTLPDHWPGAEATSGRWSRPVPPS